MLIAHGLDARDKVDEGNPAHGRDRRGRLHGIVWVNLMFNFQKLLKKRDLWQKFTISGPVHGISLLFVALELLAKPSTHLTHNKP